MKASYTHEVNGLRIRTSLNCPPIPVRSFDWCAWRDDDEPNDNGQMLQGYGATEQDAIDDLIEQIEEAA